MAITQNYQFDYRGVTFGDGTQYDVIEMEGIHDMLITDKDRNNVRASGIIPGIHEASFRLIRCRLEVRGVPGSSALWDDTQAIVTAMSPDGFAEPSESEDQFHFRFTNNEGENFVFARPIRRRLPRRQNTEFGLQPFSFELKVYDPRIYDATEQDSGTKTGTFDIVNNGDAITYPILEFDPSGSGAKLTNNTNGSIIEFASTIGGTSGVFWEGGRWVRGRADLLIAYRTTNNQYDKLVAPRGPFYLSPGTNSCTLNVGDGVIIKHHHTWM